MKKQEFKLSSLAKNDIDELMEIHVRRARTHLRDLLLKLYKRNPRPGEPSNLSYERLLGKLISLQDTMAEVIAASANQTISKIIQRMATAVFLPIP